MWNLLFSGKYNFVGVGVRKKNEHDFKSLRFTVCSGNTELSQVARSRSLCSTCLNSVLKWGRTLELGVEFKKHTLLSWPHPQACWLRNSRVRPIVCVFFQSSTGEFAMQPGLRTPTCSVKEFQGRVHREEGSQEISTLPKACWRGTQDLEGRSRWNQSPWVTPSVAGHHLLHPAWDSTLLSLCCDAKSP